jgi:RimJ/RimL family protein N-acetyltransferase
MLKIKLRDISREDLPVLERWFEDEETKARLGGMLPLARYFEFVLSTTNQKNFMAVSDNTPVGLVGFETYEDKTASIDLIVNPDYRNHGYGKAILFEAIKLLDGCTEVHAYIERDNTASMKCFGACGYVECGVDKDGLVDYVFHIR